MRKIDMKKIWLRFSPVFIFLLHLPFVFAKVEPAAGKKIAKTTAAAAPLNHAPAMPNAYDSLSLAVKGLSRQAFDCAIKGLDYMKEVGKVTNANIISIIDFSKSSAQKRLFIIDLKNYRLLFNTLVAHGANSGQEFARTFSNKPESNMSSLGFYKTADTYIGKHGYSMHLQGVEKGINDNAYTRDIVMHGADYVNDQYVQQKGFIGRSWGCPAVSDKLSKPIIDKIKNGTCLFIYSPDRNYMAHSKIIKQVSNADYALN